MQRPALFWLLLLPLVIVLLFGNCGGGGGGVRGVVTGMTVVRHQRFNAIVAQHQALEAAARRQLKGAARREAYRRLDALKAARLDSFFHPMMPEYEEYPYPSKYIIAERKKYARRPRKMTRQLLSPHNRPLIGPIRMSIDTR